MLQCLSPAYHIGDPNLPLFLQASSISEQKKSLKINKLNIVKRDTCVFNLPLEKYLYQTV